MTKPTTDDRKQRIVEAARAAVIHQSEGIAAVATDIDESFLAVVRIAYECTGKVFVTGAGTSGAVARRMAHLLSVSGTPSMFISAADALHGTMGAMTAGDVLIAISKGGASAEINELATRARDRGVDEIVALTSAPDSKLAQLSDVVVNLTVVPGIDPGEAIAMGSTLVTSAWGDALALVLMRLRGYSWEAVLHSHPSGAVGQMSDAPADLARLEPYWE